ncbi:Mitotic spindle assembly checkpoint protein MAD1 [Schistosoma japonicum]|nr:Mitotic spindle assembly checkpoint protein MAD1 [Schistosoma japonicum]KAH8874764.1 Mitotic spindle assembly checkpoint protein MAD1 [Schistosoma japonicum]
MSELSIVRAQKSSSEFALSSAQIKHESKIKTLKTEKEIIESEKNNLVNEHNSLKRKYELLEFERNCDQSKMRNFQRNLDDRINYILQSSSSLGSSLTLETERLRDEVLNYEKQLTDLQSAHFQLQARVKELEALLELRSLRLKELEMYVEEKSTELKELTELKSTVFKLNSEKAILEERILLESNRTKMPEGYDRFMKGASYVAKLEMEHDRLKATFKNLSQERAKWLITDEENSELRNQVEILKKWRERALIAENTLLEKETLMNSLMPKITSPLSDNHSSISTLRRLERENEILLSEQGEINAKNKELLTILKATQDNETHLRDHLQAILIKLQDLKKIRRRGSQITELLTKENNLCQNLLDSYILHENDTFIIPSEYRKSMYNLKELFNDFNENDKEYTTNFNNLFKLTEKIGNTNKADDSYSDVSSNCSAYESDRALVKKLRQEISELEVNNEKLRAKNIELTNKLEIYNMQGMCDTENTKILTYKYHPGEIIKQNLSSEISELRLLTERQRQRIQVLEERIIHLSDQRNNQNCNTDVTMDLDITNAVESLLRTNPDPLTELAEVKEQLRVERLRGDRLMELFDKAKVKYRTSYRDLLGYRINIQSCGDCQVCPVFTSNSEETLYFKKVDGNFELVENQFTKSLPENIHNYLNVNHSIPGFLASITLYYLQQNTLLI